MSMITIFILIGILAYTMTNILMQPEMIFIWYYDLLQKLPKYLAKPLGLCEYCLAGQLAFWYYIFYYHHCYDATHHIMLTALSIFTVEFINHLFVYFKK